jgi:hypothetical protein
VHRNKKERDRDILEKENGVWEKRNALESESNNYLRIKSKSQAVWFRG